MLSLAIGHDMIASNKVRNERRKNISELGGALEKKHVWSLFQEKIEIARAPCYSLFLSGSVGRSAHLLGPQGTSHLSG